jgi:NAD+ diphosphatase
MMATFTPGIDLPEDDAHAVYWFLYQEDRLLVQQLGDGQMALPQASTVAELPVAPLRIQYLGRLTTAGGLIHCFSGELPGAMTAPDGFAAVDLRQVFDAFDTTLFGLAGRAKQIAHWDRDHQFCGRCATPMTAMAHERAKRCPACGLTNYPRLSPAMIVAVTRTGEDGVERILLARNHRFPNGRYSVIAGFVEPGESLEDCVRREVCEEVGIDVDEIRYFGSQPWPFPNSLMVGFTARYTGGDIRLEELEIADAQWFTADSLPQVPPKISIARQLIDWFVAQHGSADARVEDWRVR